MQCLEREGRVADPGEAIVPVALSPRRLGQRRGERGDRGTRGHVGQALDCERRALDHAPPGVVDRPRPVQPGAPETRGGGQPRVGLIDALWRLELLGPRDRAIELFALLEAMPCPDPFPLDADLHVSSEPDRLAGPGRIGRMTVTVDQRPLRRRTPVVEDGLADQLDIDIALQTHDGAHQHVIAVIVSGRPGVRGDLVLATARTDGQRVTNQYPTHRRVPRRDESVRTRFVDSRRRHVDPEGAQPEATGLAVKERAEHAWRVEARDGEPVDRAVGSDERPGVAVRQEGVCGNRRER